MAAAGARRTRLTGWLVAWSAVLAVGLTAGAYPGGTDGARAAGRVAKTTKVSPPALLDLPANPRVLLLGDSYTKGIGAAPETMGFAYRIAAPLGWQLTHDGKGGSGYANPSNHNDGVYADRLWQFPVNGYDLVVLQGSSNDRDRLDLATRINITIRTVQKREPHARIVMLGPTNPYGNPGADMLLVNAKLKAGAAAYGIPFMDALAEHWFVPGDSVEFGNPVNGHPNNAGYARITWFFVRDIKALSVVRAPG